MLYFTYLERLQHITFFFLILTSKINKYLMTSDFDLITKCYTMERKNEKEKLVNLWRRLLELHLYKSAHSLYIWFEGLLKVIVTVTVSLFIIQNVSLSVFFWEFHCRNKTVIHFKLWNNEESELNEKSSGRMSNLVL